MMIITIFFIVMGEFLFACLHLQRFVQQWKFHPKKNSHQKGMNALAVGYEEK